MERASGAFRESEAAMTSHIRPFLVVALAATTAACGYRIERDAGDRVSTADAPTVTSAPVEPTVVYVDQPLYPERVYFYEPDDFDHVYYFVDSRPDVFFCLSVVRERGRSYCVERDRDVERRVCFDDRLARDHRFARAEHVERLHEAREREMRERAAWEMRRHGR
jgi:hypothetical protein